MNLRGNGQLLKNINDMISSSDTIENLNNVQDYIDSILSDARYDLDNSFDPESMNENKELRDFISNLEHIKRDIVKRKNELSKMKVEEANELNEEIEEIEVLDEDKEPTVELPKIKEKDLMDEDKEPTIELPNLETINSAKKLAKELEGVYKNNETYSNSKNIELLKNEKKELEDEYNKLNEQAFKYNLYDDKEMLDKLTNMKEKIKNIDTELSNMKIGEDVTLKQEKEVNVNKHNNDTIELRNIKCIYKPSLNVWQISAEAGLDSVYSKMYVANKTRFYSNADLNYDANMIKKYNLDNASKMDYSLCEALEQFDKEMHTNILERYATNTFDGDVIYDLRELFKTPKQMLTRKEKFQVMRNAKNQKEGRNAEVYYLNTKKAQRAVGEKQTITPIERAAVGTALGATVAAASLGAHNINENNKVKGEVIAENVVNNQEEKQKEDLEKTTVISMNDINNKTDILQSGFNKSSVLEPKEDNKKIDMPKSDNNIFIDMNVNEFDDDPKGLKLGDKLYLDNVMLTYDSNGRSPRKNTDQLNFEYYKMCYLAVLKDGKVVEILDKNKIDELKDKSLKDIQNEFERKYGNIDIEVNFNGYYDDENYIKNQGWVNVEEILKSAKNDIAMTR